MFGWSSVFSVLGIVASIIGIIGGIFYIVLGTLFSHEVDTLTVRMVYCVTGGVLLIFMILNLIMWSVLKIKTSKQDVPGIEKIAKVYTYLSGSLDIMTVSGRIMLSIMWLTSIHPFYGLVHLVWIDFTIVSLVDLSSLDLHIVATIIHTTVFIYSAICLIFTCLKIHGTRVENNKLLGIYLGFCYALFILYIILSIVLFDIKIYK